MKSAGSKVYGSGPAKLGNQQGDPWRSGSQAVASKPEGTKGAVPVTKAPLAEGNQGEHNRKHKDIKDNPGNMREKQSVGTISPLEHIGGTKLGDKKGASNAKRVLYPSATGTGWPGRKAP